jgi:PAS domain S-box-containing protein
MSVIAGDPVNPKNEMWWSDRFRVLCGYESEKDFPNILSSWASLLHPDDLKRVVTAFGDHMNDHSGKTPYSIEYRLLTKHKGYRWFHATGATKRTDTGVPLRVAGSLTDIDDAKNFSLEQERWRSRFELVNSSSQNGLWDIALVNGDPYNSQCEVWWSDKFIALLGYTGERDFPNTLDTWLSKIHPDEKKMVMSALIAHLKDASGRTEFDVVFRLVAKNGQYKWFSTRAASERDKSGQAIRIAGVLQDIEEQKQMNLRMQESIETAAAATAEFAAQAETISLGARSQTRQVEANSNGVNSLLKSLEETNVNVEHASAMSTEAGVTAEKGGQVIGKTISAMNVIADVVSDAAVKVVELGQSSHRIGEIIGVISSIADQTNLLALNAAIEAARAGAEGRGFAVVAEEVRKLAEHTVSSTQEISSVIQQIQSDTSQVLNSIQHGSTEVERGRALAGEAEEALSKIIESVKNVDELVSKVREASEFQLATSQEIKENSLKIVETTAINEACIQDIVAGSASIENIIQGIFGTISQSQSRQKGSSTTSHSQSTKLRMVG